VRPDDGYMIDIRAVNADGQLDAAYANPRPLPFSRAATTVDGKTRGARPRRRCAARRVTGSAAAGSSIDDAME